MIKLDKRIQRITYNCLEHSYEVFKRLYPNEEPYIRVICTRNRKKPNDPKYDQPWRKIMIDTDSKQVSEPINPPKLVTKIQTVSVDPSKPGDRVNHQYDPEIARINEMRRRKRETIIAEREVVQDINTAKYGADYIVDGQLREYTGSVLISDIHTFNISHIESIRPITQAIITKSTIIQPTNIMEATELLEKHLDEIKYHQDQIESKIKLIESQSIGIQAGCQMEDKSVMANRTTRSGKELWSLLIYKWRYQNNFSSFKQKAISKMLFLKIQMKKKLENQRKELQEILQKNMVNDDDIKLADEMRELTEKIKKSIAGNQSVNQICDKYFMMQKKLNDLRSFITPILVKHTKFQWEKLVVKYGFIGSLSHVIKYFDESYDSDCDEPDDYIYD
jgi:hypothetical protein